MTNLEMNKNIADYIGVYCSQQNMSISKFSEKCGIPYMTMKRIMACNVQKIDVYTVTRIAAATHASITELLGIHNENQELYKRLGRATPYNRQVIASILDMLDQLSNSGEEQRDIAYVDLTNDKISYLLETRYLKTEGLDYDQMQKISFRSTFQYGMEYCAFRLPDNALHPFYHKGSLLLVRREDPGDGDIGAFVWRDEGYIRMIFRRIRKNGRYTELYPITDRGRTYIIDTENIASMMKWVKVGIVVGVIR
ncbi:MAG: hypothetical protein PHE06_11040 [Lachnospiraceae bacterium]|nr:hypothetical protein [Lachnospiraceae bacterium]MDD3796483.1 hypothetical protein [Lachnospiraceae bacterium]